jgi:hypothetical protein
VGGPPPNGHRLVHSRSLDFTSDGTAPGSIQVPGSGQHVPTIALLVGSGVVVASELFLLWHEAQRRPQAQPAPPWRKALPSRIKRAASVGLVIRGQ